MERLRIEKLGPLGNVDVEFGDLTIIVGPQASGKSVFLETFKLANDREFIVSTLERYGFILGHKPKKILDAYFGQGMSAMWTNETRVTIGNRHFLLDTLIKDVPEETKPHVFYVPAQRVVCMANGYPRNFGDFLPTTPYVVREFSEILRKFFYFGLAEKKKIFPVPEHLKGLQKKAFDNTIFHGAKLIVDEFQGQYRMKLDIDDLHVPFMAWSAGQKEFIPLFLTIYCLQGPTTNLIQRDAYNTVIIEEPEMGLHPRAIISVLQQILDLMQSGYKVIISTHSSVVMEFAWAFNTLRNNSTDFNRAICNLFNVRPESSVGRMLSGIEAKTVKAYLFDNNSDNIVTSTDISRLDVASDVLAESAWGGIAEFSARVNTTVANYLRQ